MHADISRHIHAAPRAQSRAASGIAFTKAIWAFPVALTLHNLEDLILLPQWSHGAGGLHPSVGPVEYGFAVALMTVLAWLATARASRFGRESGSMYLALGYVAAMVANVFVPHVLAAAVTGGYVPGLGTGLAVNLPVGAYLLSRALREGQVTGNRFAVTTVATILFLVGLVPILFAVGRWLTPFV